MPSRAIIPDFKGFKSKLNETMTANGAIMYAGKDLSGQEEREMPDLGDIDIVTSEEIWRLALKEYSSLKLETEASHKDIVRHSSSGRGSIQERSDQKRSASVGPTGSSRFKSKSPARYGDGSTQRTAAQDGRSSPDTEKRARSKSLGPSRDKEMPAAERIASKASLYRKADSSLTAQSSPGSSSKGKVQKEKNGEKVHVPYYYRVTRHASESGMAPKTIVSQSKKARKNTRKASKQLKDLKKNRPPAAATVNSTPVTQKSQPIITFEQSMMNESELVNKKQLAASVTSKSSKHPKRSSAVSRNDVNLLSAASVRSSNSYKGKISSAKDSSSRAASTPTAKKRKGRKKYDETASRKTQGSKMSILSSAKDRICRIFGISSSKNVKRNTEDTVPMDILNIRMDSSVWNNIPGSTRDLGDFDPPSVRVVSDNERRSTSDFSDRSLTMGTPKRDPAVGWHDFETPVSCLSMPNFETGGARSGPTIKPKKSKYRNRNSNGSEVFDMPWSDAVFHGKYTGPIDGSLNPHGKGAITIKGVWEHGELIYPVINCPSAPIEANSQPRSPIVSNEETVTLPTKDELTASTAQMTSTSSGVNRNLSERSSMSSIDSYPYVVTDNDPASTNQSIHSNSIKSQSSRNSIKPKWAYRIGQVSRSPNDMIIHRSHFDAIDSVSMIQNMQQAFVKRSSGLWTCAVLVERALQPTNGKRWYPEWEIDNFKEAELEESMLFVINDDGSTKIVNKRNWGKFVRRMKADVNDGEDTPRSGCGAGLNQRFETIEESETPLSESENIERCKDAGTPSDGAGNHPISKVDEEEVMGAALDDAFEEPLKEDTSSDATVEVSNREENALCDYNDCDGEHSEVDELTDAREGQDERCLGVSSVSIEIEEEVSIDQVGQKDDVFKKSSLTASTVLSRSSLARSSLSNSMLNDIDW